MNNLEEFVSKLNLPVSGKLVNSEYVINISDSDTFSKIYNDISTNADFHIDDNSIATVDKARFIFYDDWFELRFYANFEVDSYKLVIGER